MSIHKIIKEPDYVWQLLRDGNDNAVLRVNGVIVFHVNTATDVVTIYPDEIIDNGLALQYYDRKGLLVLLPEGEE